MNDFVGSKTDLVEVQRLFDGLNTACFEKRLGPVRIYYNEAVQADRAWGWYLSSGRIYLSPQLLTRPFQRRQTLLHEMVHHELRPYTGHGPRFQWHLLKAHWRLLWHGGAL